MAERAAPSRKSKSGRGHSPGTVPWRFGTGHQICDRQKAVPRRDRTPSRWRDERRFRNSARSWTAPVLWRFGLRGPQRHDGRIKTRGCEGPNGIRTQSASFAIISDGQTTFTVIEARNVGVAGDVAPLQAAYSLLTPTQPAGAGLKNHDPSGLGSRHNTQTCGYSNVRLPFPQKHGAGAPK